MAGKKLTPEEYARKREKERAYELAYRERNRVKIRKRQRAKYWVDVDAARARTRASQRKNYDPSKRKVTNDKYITKIGRVARNAYQRAWYAAHRESEIARIAAYREANLERLKAYSHAYEEKNREARRQKTRKSSEKHALKRLAYRQANKTKIAATSAAHEAKNHARRRMRHAERQATDIGYRLRRALRARVAQALRKQDLPRGKDKVGSAVTLLGCSAEDLRKHLERQFHEGMSWDNYGGRHGWQVDHVRELVTFDLSKSDDWIVACHFTNLQPLWKQENISKGALVRWGRVRANRG